VKVPRDTVTAGKEGVMRSRWGELIEGRMTPEDLAALHEEARMVAGEHAEIDVMVNGSNVVAFGEKLASGARALVQRLEINRGDNALFTFLHESVEADWRAGVAAGKISREETRRAIAFIAPAFDPATARDAEERAFRERVQRVARGEASETELRETLSELAVADALGRRRDDSRMPAGSVTAALDSAIRGATDAQAAREIGRVRAFLRAVRQYFRALLGTVAALKRARREGLAEDFDVLLDKITGRDEQAAHEQAAAEEVERDYVPPTEEETEAGIAFSLKKGASLNSQKREIPKTAESMPRFVARGEFEAVRARVVEWMRQHPVATAPDGRVILIANPEKGSLETRAEHWMGSHARNDVYKQRARQFVYDKAQSISAIPHTVEGAQVKARSHTGAVIYLRKYAGGELHAVFTDEDGRITEHGLVQGGVETQYTLDPKSGIEGATVLEDWTEKVAPAPSVNPSQGAEVDRASTPGRQPKNQQGGTPSAPAQGHLASDGSIVNEGGAAYRLSAGSRLELIQKRVDAALARDPARRRDLARRASAKLQALQWGWETERFTPKGDRIRPVEEQRRKGELDKEQAVRQALRTEELTEAGMATLSNETLMAFDAGAQRLEDHPLIAAMLGHGKLVSKSTALRRYADAQGYDDAPWLPPKWYAGKGQLGIAPDEMAQMLYEDGLLKSTGDIPTPADLWRELEGASRRRGSAVFEL
jgi:hypothetical protein